MSDKFDKAMKVLEKSKRNFQVTRLSDPHTLARVHQWISTGNVVLDAMMGGGYPVRRITEIFGDSTTGKTLFAVDAVIDTQNIGGMAAYADAEIALGYERMIELGVDGTKLAYGAVNTVDDTFLFLDDCIEAKNEAYGKDAILTFVVDSIAALATKDELESAKEGYESKDYPRAAIALSKIMRQLPAKVAENNVCLILINQTRENIGVMFGEQFTTYGGRAVGFYSSLRLMLQSSTKLKATNQEIIGVTCNVKTYKNRLAPPLRTAKAPIYYAYGVDESETIFNFLKDRKLIKQAGAWFTWDNNGEEIKFQKKTFRPIFDKHYDTLADIVEAYYNNIEVAEDQDEEPALMPVPLEALKGNTKV